MTAQRLLPGWGRQARRQQTLPNMGRCTHSAFPFSHKNSQRPYTRCPIKASFSGKRSRLPVKHLLVARCTTAEVPTSETLPEQKRSLSEKQYPVLTRSQREAPRGNLTAASQRATRSKAADLTAGSKTGSNSPANRPGIPLQARKRSRNFICRISNR